MHLVVSLSPCLDEVYVLDALRPGAVLAGMDPIVHAGGKGSNVARALRSLGCSVTLLGAFGGATGERIAGELKRERIDTVFVPADGESRRCVILVERRYRRQTVLNGTAPPIPPRSLDRLCGRLSRALDAGAAAVVLTGSLPRDCPREVYAKIASLAARAGVPLLLDSSGAGLNAGLAGRSVPSILKVNRRELRSLAAGGSAARGREPSLAETMRAAQRTRRRFGVREVVVTGGVADVVAITGGNRRLVARPPRVRCVNAVGSGDAFAAGFVADVAAPLEHRLARAIAAGAANCEELAPCRLSATRVDALAKRILPRVAAVR
ncbi:MAG: hypothetical protein HYR85_27930 [Planctomycetes bacterium]|nr:hypothetical protein [Planctomycetota bacterium]MBI3846108.1 hypothetical protein [Planctomycetota bacterium]